MRIIHKKTVQITLFGKVINEDLYLTPKQSKSRFQLLRVKVIIKLPEQNINQ